MSEIVVLEVNITVFFCYTIKYLGTISRKEFAVLFQVDKVRVIFYGFLIVYIKRTLLVLFSLNHVISKFVPRQHFFLQEFSVVEGIGTEEVIYALHFFTTLTDEVCYTYR